MHGATYLPTVQRVASCDAQTLHVWDPFIGVADAQIELGNITVSRGGGDGLVVRSLSLTRRTRVRFPPAAGEQSLNMDHRAGDGLLTYPLAIHTHYRRKMTIAVDAP